jgi:hypothetical protein
VIEELADAFPGGFNSSLSGFTKQGFELGEDLLDGIEVRAVGWQEQELGACGTKGTADGFALVTAEIIDDDDIAGSQRRHQDLLDIGEEAAAIDRPIDDARRIDPIGAQSGEESERSPVAVRCLGDQPLASGAPSVGARHIGLGPGLVDKDEACGVKPTLILLPSGAPASDVGSVLLAGVQTFF